MRQTDWEQRAVELFPTVNSYVALHAFLSEQTEILAHLSLT